MVEDPRFNPTESTVGRHRKENVAWIIVNGNKGDVECRSSGCDHSPNDIVRRVERRGVESSFNHLSRIVVKWCRPKGKGVKRSCGISFKNAIAIFEFVAVAH